MLKALVFASIMSSFLFSSWAQAQKKNKLPPRSAKAETSLREKANLEINQPEQNPAKKPAQSKEATAVSQQSSGVIQLQDQYSGLEKRTSTYHLGLKFQQLLHIAKAPGIDAKQNSLANLETTVKPSIAFAMTSQTKPLRYFNFAYGAELIGGFTSQNIAFTTLTNINVDGRLQYFELAARPYVYFPWQSLAFVSTKVFAEYGQAQLALASRASALRFNKSMAFYGYGIALDFKIFRNWQIEVEYFERKTQQFDPNWILAARNTQMGVQYQW